MFLDPSGFVAEPDLIRALSQHAIPLDCSEGRKLFRQGDDPSGLFVLDSGDVTKYATRRACIAERGFIYSDLDF